VAFTLLAMTRRRSIPVEIARALGLLAAFLVTCIVAGLLASGFYLPAAAATGFLTRSGYDYYQGLPADLDETSLPEYSTILAADGSIIANIYEQNRFEVPLANVSQTMIDATLAIEDSRFYEHNGIDARGTLRAAIITFGGVDVAGGSTLTQQYVKNVRVQAAAANNDEDGVNAAIASGADLEGFRRKFDEARYAMGLEQKYTKDEILNKYLNIAFFGNNAYGVAAASKFYFQVNPIDLTIPQAAMLAGILQRPTELDPVKFPDAAINRRNTVLARMLSLGKITQADFDTAIATDLGINPLPLPNGCLTAGEMAFFCDYVIQDIIGANLAAGQTSPYAALGETASERQQNLYRGGLTIPTTINPALQSVAWQSVRSQIPDTERAGVAMATVEPGTGRILAMAQNRLYGDANGTYQLTKVNYVTGSSIGFQPGSTFKPFTLATWLKANKPLSAVVNAGDFEGPTKSFPARCTQLDGKIYTAGNAGDSGGPAGQVPVLRATYNSINGAYLRMAQQLDLCDIAETAASLGVTDISGRPDGAGQPGGYNIVPSMVLGAANVSPLAVAGAYAAFAAEGLFCPPTGVTGVLDRDGQPVVLGLPACTQALDPEVAKGVNYALQQTLIQGTARSLGGIGRPAAGKTGTTNGSNATWFSGYTPNLASTVWIGDTDIANQTLTEFPVNGEIRRRGVFGSTWALPTWGDFMRQAPQLLGLPPAGFADPGEDTIFGPPVRVPNVRGSSVSQASATLAAAGLGITVSDERRGGSADRVVDQSPGSGATVRGGTGITVYLGGGGGGGGDGGGGGGGNGNGNGGLLPLPPGINPDAAGVADAIRNAIANGRPPGQTP